MEIIKLSAQYLEDYLGIIAMIYMIKYFSCHEIDINKNLCIFCGIYEGIVVTLDRLQVVSDGLIQNVLVFIIVLFYTYKLGAFKKTFCIVPSFFVCIMLSCIIFLFLSIFSKPLFWGEDVAFEGFTDNMVVFIGLILDISIILFIQKKIKENLYFSITKLDVFIINIIIIVSYILIFVMDAFKQITIYGQPIDRLIIVLIAVCGITMDISILISMFKVKSAYYYKNMNEINEHYMEMQLKHFEAYKNSQIETRRIKHDMKNHIICINELLGKNRLQELKEYIDDLKEDIEGIDSSIRTGNVILDSIINEKYTIIKKEGIDFSINGYLHDKNTMQPVDICTIFANAIDNAIEASLKEKDKNKRKIDISIKENKNFIFITFINNMIMVKRRGKNNFFTTKMDSLNHGFGILNIQYAVDKYNGDIDIETEGNKFKLEIVLPK